MQMALKLNFSNFRRCRSCRHADGVGVAEVTIGAEYAKVAEAKEGVELAEFVEGAECVEVTDVAKGTEVAKCAEIEEGVDSRSRRSCRSSSY